jgi:predicted permease
LAVRAALGAGRARVARQLLTESVLLGIMGGAVGVLVAAGGVRVFRTFAPAELPRLAEIAVDVRVLAFALMVSIVTGILFGLAPVLNAARGQVAGRLREAALGHSGGTRSHHVRGVLVTLQTAIALVLLMGAALLINGFVRLSTVDAGFDVDNVVWLNLQLPTRRYESAAARAAFFERALDEVRALPGVRAAGAIHGMPLDGNSSRTSVLPEGAATTDAEQARDVLFHSVLPGYFSALGIRLLEGRDVSALDRTGSTPVAVLSEAFARSLWPGERALGKRFALASDAAAPLITVIAIAADVRHYGLAHDPEPMMYLPFAHFPRNLLGIAVKHDGAAAPLLGAIRAAIWSLDPALPLDDFGTMRERVSSSLGDQRFRTYLLSTFAVVALLLTFVGLYGTMAHMVRARRREMGIRLALGAAARDVRSLVVGRGMRIAAIGILLGTIGALAATRLLASFVFGVTTTDPLTFTAGIAFMAATAFLACWLPARRAAAIDPARTLRAE